MTVRETLRHKPNMRATEKEEDARNEILKVNSVTTYVGPDVALGMTKVKPNATGNVTTDRTVEESDTLPKRNGLPAARMKE